jgi:hypothetical protein
MGNTTGHKATVGFGPPVEYQACNGVLSAIRGDECGHDLLPVPPQEPAEYEHRVFVTTHGRWATIKFRTHRYRHMVDGRNWRWNAFFAEWEFEAENPPEDIWDGFTPLEE